PPRHCTPSANGPACTEAAGPLGVSGAGSSRGNSPIALPHVGRVPSGSKAWAVTASNYGECPPSPGAPAGAQIFDTHRVTRKATAQPNTTSPARWRATSAPPILDCSTTAEAMIRAAVAGASRQLDDNLTT